MGFSKINKVFKKELLYVFLIIFLFFILIVKFIFSTSVLLWDEPVYLSNAMSHLQQTYFTEDFRFPLLEYFIAFFWFLFGISVFNAQILILLFSLLSIYIFYLISKKIFVENYYRILSVFLFSTSYLLIYWSFRVYPDIPSLSMLLASIYLFFKYKDTNSKFIFFNKYFLWKKIVFIFLSGMFTSIAFLLKFPGAIASLVVVPYLIYKKKFKSFFFYALGNIFILTPWILYNYLQYSNPLWDLLEQSKIISMYTVRESSMVFLNNFFLSIYFMIVFLFLFFIFYFFNEKLSKNFYVNFIFILFILSIFYYLFGVKLKLFRYHLQIFPFALLLSIIGLKYLVNFILNINYFKFFFKKFKFLLIIVLLICVLINSFFQMNLAINTINEKNHIDKNSAFLKSINYADENIAEGELIISNYWPWYGFYGNHISRPIWNNNINLILSNLNNGYLFLVRYHYQKDLSKDLEFNGYLKENITDIYGNNVLIYEVYK
ncbi:MAG: glycosyltransferase family 39 protein [Nanoarchaeota archaeon]